MTKTLDKTALNKFLSALAKDFFIMAPQYAGEDVRVAEITNISDIDWTGQMPKNPWKQVFLPAAERLFNFNKNNITESRKQYPQIACVGMNVLDLKALTLFDQVFSDDVYYQQRRNNLLIIGFTADWPIDYKKYKVFSHNYEEDILEHLSFDIFVAKLKNNQLKIYSGSPRGQQLLEKYGIKDYKNIEFAGAVPEKGPDKRMLTLIDKVSKSYNKKLWSDLDKLCLACGKCSIACPTCFCFDFSDQLDPEESNRRRHWGNCFYNDFSKVAGGAKELDTVKKKIFFWYTHKFVRIPKEYALPGCVSCGRCTRACPVGIDIAKNIRELNK